uniref:poly(A)-specific ribonuclease n=1 Tax=Pan paniscus TaxID=9597 RepID=A0A2R9BNX2_PANPA
MPAATVHHSQRICEVWACNVDEEMKKIRQVIRKYNYVAMDTEFPGVVARPTGEFRSNADYQYQLLRCNDMYAQNSIDYNFGYLIKMLTNSNLPEEELDFFEILRLFLPVIYDVKYLMKSCKHLKDGLQEVAEQLELAGSKSLLTGMAFFKMRGMFFEDHTDDAKYCGHLYGLGSGSSYVQNGTGNAYEEEANKQS